jgi:hypothetical protein
MENMNGRKRVEEGELCDRRNGDWSISHKLITTGSCYANMVYIYISLWALAGRGVDLNRNWSVDWGKKEKVSISVFTGKIKYASSLA